MKSKHYFENSTRRPGCHPCDRSEAAHQLNRINHEIDTLNVSLSRLRHIDD